MLGRTRYRSVHVSPATCLLIFGSTKTFSSFIYFHYLFLVIKTKLQHYVWLLIFGSIFLRDCTATCLLMFGSKKKFSSQRVGSRNRDVGP
jgi:hypothetical protein